MDVTKLNAHLVYDDFKEQIRRCEFMAVDQEMTGVNIPGADRVTGLSPGETYRRLRDAVLKYNAFQYGVCLFTKTTNGEYEARPYNFYLLKKNGFLVFDNSVFPFHVQHKLDFTKWFSSGIPYCTKEQEEEIMHNTLLAPADAVEQEQMDNLLSEVKQWYAGSDAALDVVVRCTLHFTNVVRSFFESADNNFTLSLAISGSPYFAEPVKFHFEKLSEDAFRSKIASKNAEQESQTLKKIGFRLFWKEITASKKPIVGHNFFQDLMFMLNMHESTLPEDYETFKRDTHALLPEIYDTKAIAYPLSSKFPVTHLGVLYNQCRAFFDMNATQFSKFFHLPPGFFEYNDECIKLSSKAHEGAYDAYMTGVVFIYLQLHHPETLAACKNLICIFAATHFFKNGGATDPFYTETYMISTKRALFIDQVESFLFSLENRRDDFITNGKVDFKKLNYMVCPVNPDALKQSNLFCVLFKSAGDSELLKQKVAAYEQRSTEEEPGLLNLHEEQISFTPIEEYYLHKN